MHLVLAFGFLRELEEKEKKWEAKKAAKAAEEKRLRKEKRRIEKEGGGNGEQVHMIYPPVPSNPLSFFLTRDGCVVDDVRTDQWCATCEP